VDALIAAGVARVIVATGDSNPNVAGGGIARLRAAGIDVQDGLLRDNARALNQGFFSRMERGRPWVRVKIAASLDGRIALGTGESKWITGSAARADVQRWRARSSALMTGIGTVLADDPRLTARPRISGRRERPVTKAAVPRLRDESTAPIAANLVPPLRVILDSTLRTPAQARILDGEAPALIVHARDATPVDARFDRIERIAVDCVEGRLDLVAVLQALAAREVNELQIEAGSTLVGSFLRSGLVDEVLIYIAPVFLGDTARPIASMPGLAALKDARTLTLVEQRTLRPDVRLRLLSEFHDVHRNH
jgi:diaminohydroxyphosphoribosylaminopyrimidine deaminase/5-amino-6-(5-phosphoribosylamino)uracil reductase